MHRTTLAREPGLRRLPFPICLSFSTALILSFVAGCNVIEPTGSRSAVDDGLIQVEEGGSVRLGRTAAVLYFEEVVRDSRCPTDVDCIWQGEAEARFVLSRRSDEAFSLTIPGLVRVPYEDNEEVILGGDTIKLLELSPYPVFHRDGPAPPYRALLRIEDGGRRDSRE